MYRLLLLNALTSAQTQVGCLFGFLVDGGRTLCKRGVRVAQSAARQGVALRMLEALDDDVRRIGGVEWHVGSYVLQNYQRILDSFVRPNGLQETMWLVS